jgi:hypothetical protein
MCENRKQSSRSGRAVYGQEGECAGMQARKYASSKRVCGHAGKRACGQASKCEYVRAGVRVGRGSVDRQGSVRA